MLFFPYFPLRKDENVSVTQLWEFTVYKVVSVWSAKARRKLASGNRLDQVVQVLVTFCRYRRFFHISKCPGRVCCECFAIKIQQGHRSHDLVQVSRHTWHGTGGDVAAPTDRPGSSVLFYKGVKILHAAMLLQRS